MVSPGNLNCSRVDHYIELLQTLGKLDVNYVIRRMYSPLRVPKEILTLTLK